MWRYRTGRDGGAPLVLYEYQPSGQAEHAEKFLEPYFRSLAYCCTDRFYVHRLTRPAPMLLLIFLLEPLIESTYADWQSDVSPGKAKNLRNPDGFQVFGTF